MPAPEVCVPHRGTAPTDVDDLVLGAFPAWGREQLDAVSDDLLSLDRPFPCTFAVAAARKRTLRFAFVEDLDDERTWATLPDVLRGYVDTYRTISRDTSLIVLFRPGPLRSMEHYHERFWSILRHLHDRDPVTWPVEVPTEPDHPLWEFSAAGEPIFVVCSTPAHRRRRSRRADTFLITFQPRGVFEGLHADLPAGRAARRVIRKRLAAYDDASVSEHLGSYGDPDNREWRQYFLDDGDREDPPAVCPFATGARDGAP